MKPSRTARAEPESVALPADRKPLFDWDGFWFAAIDPIGLHLVRIATGVLLLVWLLPLAGDVPALFGLDGWFDRTAYQQASRLEGGTPKPIGWSLTFLAGNSPTRLMWLYWGSIGVLILFTLGLFTRLTAPLTWLVVASFTAMPLFDHEADALFNILALYLAAGYLLLGLLDRSLSWPERLFGSWRTAVFARLWRGPRQPAAPSVAANAALRLLQVHLVIMMVTTGLYKLQFGDWWSGLAHWYWLHQPAEVTPEALRKRITDPGWHIVVLNLMAYGTLAWQIGFPAFAWRRGLWRLVLLEGAAIGWVGLATLYRMPLFGPALLIGCLAFVSAEEWRALRRLIGKLPLPLPAAPEPEEAEPPSRPPSRELVTTKER